MYDYANKFQKALFANQLKTVYGWQVSKASSEINFFYVFHNDFP